MNTKTILDAMILEQEHIPVEMDLLPVQRITALKAALDTIKSIEIKDKYIAQFSRIIEVIEHGRKSGEFQIIFGEFYFTFYNGLWHVSKWGTFPIVMNEPSLSVAVQKIVDHEIKMEELSKLKRGNP